MGRLVRFGPPGRADAPADEGVAGAALESGDSYLQRVAKFIPAEAVAFFIFVNSILGDPADKAAVDLAAKQAADPATTTTLKEALNLTLLGGFSLWTIAWLMVVISMLTIPFYLLAMRDKDDPSEWVVLNIAVALAAFPVWAYAVDAVAFRPWHDGALASVFLATFSFVSGAIAPSTISSIGGLFRR